MILELHILQNFAPSNLNRDDTGSPKDCEFGGYRRARISSQCLKRTIRKEFKTQDLIPVANRSDRTKRLMEELVRRLSGGEGTSEEWQKVARAAVFALGLGLDKDEKTEYLLFLGHAEIEELARLCRENWSALLEAGSDPRAAKKAESALPRDVVNALKRALDGGRAVDLALFGRMLADLPDKNRVAASQVAHAISTNRVRMEFDYYTAVDDLNPDDTAGAGMIGTVEFNSACFYRYANVDIGQLSENLQGDVDLTRSAVSAFVRASIEAVPTGKQNSMAAQNPPSFALAVLRDSGAWSLANAFVEPATPDSHDLIYSSISKLDTYWGMLREVYGDGSVRINPCFAVGDVQLDKLAKERVTGQDALLSAVERAIQAD